MFAYAAALGVFLVGLIAVLLQRGYGVGSPWAAVALAGAAAVAERGRVQLERGNGVALDGQIESSIRNGIRAGRLPRDTALPATRVLARELGVSRGVVLEAYRQLIKELSEVTHGRATADATAA